MITPRSPQSVLSRLKLPLAILSAGLLIGTASSSLAGTSIGIRFQGRGADGNPVPPLLPTESAGVVPQTNWNNINSGGTFKGTSQTMTDSSYNFTDVRVIFDANDSWNSDGGSTTTDERLMKGIIKANTGSNPPPF